MRLCFEAQAQAAADRDAAAVAAAQLREASLAAEVQVLQVLQIMLARNTARAHAGSDGGEMGCAGSVWGRGGNGTAEWRKWDAASHAALPNP